MKEKKKLHKATSDLRIYCSNSSDHVVVGFTHLISVLYALVTAQLLLVNALFRLDHIHVSCSKPAGLSLTADKQACDIIKSKKLTNNQRTVLPRLSDPKLTYRITRSMGQREI